MSVNPCRLDLSYICTVQNGERYVEEAVNSMFSADPGCEVVVIDDGSTDATAEIVRSMQSSHSRLRFVETGGIGRGAALNYAWRLAESEFITNLDSDDLALPGRLRLADWLLSAGQEYAVCAGRAITWNGVDELHPIKSRNLAFRDISDCLHRFNPISHAAVVIRKSALYSVGGYAEDRESQFDYDLWVRLALAGFGIVKSLDAVAIKRIHSQQSFEINRHLRYVLSSVLVQRRAIRGRKQAIEWAFHAAARLAWGVFPSCIRNNARAKSDFRK